MIKRCSRLFAFVILSFSSTFTQIDAAVVESSQVEKLVKVLPDDVFVLVVTNGADSLKPSFEKTILGRMWYDPGVQTFFEAVTKELTARLKREIQGLDRAGTLDAAEDFLRLVVNRPFVIGAAQKGMEDGPPLYGFAVVDAGQRKAEIAEALSKLEALADEGSIIEIDVGSLKMRGPRVAGDVPGYWGWVGNRLVFAINDGEGLALKYLQKSRTYAPDQLKKAPGTDEALALYVDCQRITDVLSYVLLGQARDSKQPNIVAKVMKELGLGDVKALTATMGFAGPDMVTNEHIEIREPRTNLFSSLRTVNLSMFDMVDDRAVSAAAVNCDFTGIYDTVMRAVGVAVPSDGYAEIRHGINKFESEAKLDIRKELLESLAGPAIFYSIPSGIMMDLPSGGTVAIVKLKDVPLFEKTMIALGTFAAAKSKDKLQVSSQVQSDGRTLHSWMVPHLAMMQALPCWAILDDYVIIVSNPQLYKTAIEQITSAGSGGESLRTTKGFIKATKKLPSNLVFLRYTDSKVLFKQMMTRLQQFWPVIGLPAMKEGIKLPAMLPSVAHIVEDMESSSQYSWFDAEGLHFHYRGPGLEPGLGTVAGASFGLGIMMPALSRTRDQARQVVSSANLKQIGLSFAMYADDHQGSFPEDIQQLTEYVGGTERFRKVFESPRKPKDFKGPSYIYIDGQSANTRRGSNYVLVYENPVFCKNKINALFLDYSVRAMGQEEFLKAMEATYQRLGRGMPEVTFKDSQKTVTPKELPTQGLKSTDKLDLSGTQTTHADLAERLEGLTSLRELNLSRARITNEGLAHLGGLNSLQKLFLGNTQINDSGLMYLRNLNSIQYLCFHGTQVGDAGLVHLEDLASLQSLCLHDTKVSDDGLAHLRGLTSLRILHLRNTQVSDTGLAHIKNLTGLQNLCVHKTQVSDTGLEYLKNLASLQSLCLHDTQVSDGGLAHLRDLTSLKNLYLQNTQVSDAGLVHLKGLTLLKQLNLSGTKVSSEGLAELERTLPDCRISGARPSVARRAENQFIDKPAPSFTLQDLDGKQVSLSDFKGKVVLLDFWATWCGPCRKAIPHLEALHKNYKDQGLVVIGINRERDHDKVKEFAKEQISYIVLLDADEQFKEYGIRGIPAAFYIDREGMMRYRDVGFGIGKEKEIKQKVKELLFGKEEIKLVTDRERQESRVPKKEEVAVLRKQKPALSQRPDENILSFDSFDGRLNLKWDILHTDLSHVSLTKNPGALTITTQKGSLRGSNKNYKNLFLIDCPAKAGDDFQVTTCLSSFKPVARYQQAGLICYNDEDNFLRFVYEWRPGQCSFTSTCEVDGRKTSTAISLIGEQLERIWLRVTKSGNWYTFSSSLDGKSFNERGAYAWGDGLVKRVGILATNGLPSKAPEIDASFDFFEVKAVAAKPAAPPAAKYVIPEENLKIPEEMQGCAENLKKIYAAIKKYEKDKGEMPNWLSDLVPDYLNKETLLCSNDATRAHIGDFDPKVPCSYKYQFYVGRIPNERSVAGLRFRDWKKQQVEFFGDVVPMVRCRHHGSGSVLNLSVGGQIYRGRAGWEKMFMPDYTRGIELSRRPMREVWPVPAKPAAAKFVVPRENLQIPEKMQACAENLKKINTAIKTYEKDEGELPDWLSDLVPKYLGTEMLLCPNDTKHETPYSPDPKLPCSYSWQFSAKPIPTGWDPTGRTIYRAWKAQQVEVFGDVVPKVRCHHHGSRCLNLSVGGQIWWGPRDWEYMFKPDYRFSEIVRGKGQISSRANFTPWMNSADYQKEFERRGKNRFYPAKVEGRTYKGENQYRAIFEPFLPRSLSFFSCHGLQEQPYVKKNKDCLSKGYKQIHLQMFEDPKGIKRYQATWIRSGAEISGRQRREIQPAGRLRIAGVARDEAGRPLAGVKLQIMPMSRGEVTSDSQGRFEVRWDPHRIGPRETIHYLVARLEERNLAVAVEIDEETTTLDVILEPGLVFTGKVVDPEGKGIAGARIMTVLRVSNWALNLARDQVADMEGKFEIRAVPLGHKYSLAARAEGYGEKRIEVHTNDAVDNRLDVGRLKLAVADLSISGMVVDADDNPVANARIYCYGEGQQYRNAQTDSNGKFILDKICRGQVRITASVSGTRRMYGYTQTEGGATDVKVVISERPSATRYIPTRPSSLRGRSLPNMKELETGLSPADANAKDEEGLTALHLAARQGRKDEVVQLLADGANVNVRLTRWPGWMALHEAAAANHKEVAELLIDKGADVNADCARAGGGRFGGTALHEAVFEGHRDMAELLISKGADINAKQSGGLTPLDVAAFVGHKDVVELLIARGADVNIRDRGGRTALRWAKHGRHKEIVELLQKHGAIE